MELEGEDGSKVAIRKGSKREIGRGLGFTSDDRTVSRRHLQLQLQDSSPEEPEKEDPHEDNTVYFEVLGINPIWVISKSLGEKRVFRKSEKGTLKAGDKFTLSLKKPFFFTLKKVDSEAASEDEEKRVLKAVERRKRRTLERKEEEEKAKQRIESLSEGNGGKGVDDLGSESFDITQIDPIKEFGFLVMGQEFESYPKQKIRDIKEWEWFLEEPTDSKVDEASEEETPRGRKGKRRKNKGEDNDEGDWTGESEDDKDVVRKLGRAKRPKYSTRSKDRRKNSQNAHRSKTSMDQRATLAVKDEEDEDADTLEGFIVNNDDLAEEDEKYIDDGEEEEEEEEEFEDKDESSNDAED